ncbi:MAG TPA: hypothetical protein VGJ48_17835 [Pyrinomonadaceae bacterium]|jgi:hypothetical protein
MTIYDSSDPTVSLDLLIRALLAAGASRKDVARAIASDKTTGRCPRLGNEIPPHIALAKQVLIPPTAIIKWTPSARRFI